MSLRLMLPASLFAPLLVCGALATAPAQAQTAAEAARAERERAAAAQGTAVVAPAGSGPVLVQPADAPPQAAPAAANPGAPPPPPPPGQASRPPAAPPDPQAEADEDDPQPPNAPPPYGPPPPPPPPRIRYRRYRPARVVPRPPPGDARQGLLFSVGLGGASQLVSSTGEGRNGAVDFDARLGYGFSDRFQLFGDINVQSASYGVQGSVTDWTATLRGQTVLWGDKRGNGLTINLGAGLGGIASDFLYGGGYDSYGGCGCNSRLGLAVAGGVAFDLRVTPWFALSPEFFANWHDVPGESYAYGVNGPLPRANATAFGLRLNLLWYLK